MTTSTGGRLDRRLRTRLPEATAGIAVNGAILAVLAYVRFGRGRTLRPSK